MRLPAVVIALFVQDDWRVGRRLTVNLGMRTEINPRPHRRSESQLAGST